MNGAAWMMNDGTYCNFRACTGYCVRYSPWDDELRRKFRMIRPFNSVLREAIYASGCTVKEISMGTKICRQMIYFHMSADNQRRFRRENAHKITTFLTKAIQNKVAQMHKEIWRLEKIATELNASYQEYYTQNQEDPYEGKTQALSSIPS